MIWQASWSLWEWQQPHLAARPLRLGGMPSPTFRHASHKENSSQRLHRCSSWLKHYCDKRALYFSSSILLAIGRREEESRSGIGERRKNREEREPAGTTLCGSNHEKCV
jgi:hypothetical protein